MFEYELEVQKYLRAGNTLESLKEIGVYTNRGNALHLNLVQFAYDQIESSAHKTNPLVKESRGLILDESDNWNVVAFPFTRFANDGEQWADSIDWFTARVQEKIDGSLMILYWYKNKWHVATRGSAGAAGSVGEWKKYNSEELWTFNDLFWHSAEYWLKGLCHSGELNTYNTYMFELTSPLNKVVCDYTKLGIVQFKCNATGEIFNEVDDVTGYAHDGSRITLIGVRNILTGKESPVHIFKDFRYVVQEFPMTSLDEVFKAAEVLDPLKQEGFVVVDANFNRIKIKSPKYVLLHHLRDGFGPRRLIDLIKLGEDGEFVTYFPEFKEQFDDFKVKYNDLVTLMEFDWGWVNAKVGWEASQKEFALEAVKTKVPAYLFARRKGIIHSATEFLKNIPAEKLLEIL